MIKHGSYTDKVSFHCCCAVIALSVDRRDK